MNPNILHYWLRIEPYWKLLKYTLFSSTASFIVLSICLYVSSFLFGALYYYSMPTTYQSYPLNFQYKRSCIQEHRKFIQTGNGYANNAYSEGCFPSAIINLDDSLKKVVDPHQTYAVHVTLQLPESPTNLQVGMFMTTMNYGSETSSQPACMKHRPFIIRTISTMLFWPFLLFNVMENSQTIDICMFERINFHFGSREECAKTSDARHSQEMVYSTQDESFSKNCNQRKVRLQVDYPDIEISAATLHVIASYSGLQYFLFQWPIFSFLLAVGIFFTPVLVSVLVLLCIIICVSYGGSYQDIHSHVLEDNNEEHPDATRCIDEDEGPADEEHHRSENDAVPSASSMEVDVIASAEYGDNGTTSED